MNIHLENKYKIYIFIFNKLYAIECVYNNILLIKLINQYQYYFKYNISYNNIKVNINLIIYIISKFKSI
jgi:hypothetical protein